MTEPIGNPGISDQERLEADRIHEQYFRAVRSRAEGVKKEYQDRTIVQDKEIKDPVKQQRNNETEATCLIATAINAMKALGVEQVPTEDEALAEVLKKDSFSNKGELGLRAVLDYLESKGVKNTHALIDSYPAELVKGLLDGGVVFACVPAKGDRSQEKSHAKLLSGVRIEDGQIAFREYDPDPKEPLTRLVSLDTYIEEVYGVNALTTATLLKR